MARPVPAPGGTSARGASADAAGRFARAGVPSRDAEVILAAAMGLSMARVAAEGRRGLSPQELATFRRGVDRRLAGEPLAYIVGTAPFLDFEVAVDGSVLVPRPETELLAEWAIARARARGHRRALDVGTGCGVLAIALARGVPGLRVVATDVAPGALAVARRNAEALGVADRVDFHLADLAPPHLEGMPLIVANLPYVGLRERGAVEPAVLRHEPREALFAGSDGLLQLRRLVARLPSLIAAHGDLGVEIGWHQGASSLALVRRGRPTARLCLRPDLGGRPRLLVAEAR